MSFGHSFLSIQTRSRLTFLPEEIRQKILEYLHSVIRYEPVAGVMGKSGTGKSSLCNAIFQPRICTMHPLNDYTHQVYHLTLRLNEHKVTLIDLLDVGEILQHDQGYRELYHQLLPELDLVIWILRTDKRAYTINVTIRQFLLNEDADPSHFLFVLSHADCVSPVGR